MTCDLSGAFFSTRALASDVIAALDAKDVRDYMLFGVSYGTQLGTVLAHDLEDTNRPPPRAIVFEGVLGKVFSIDGKDAPFGISAEGWSRALIALLPASPLTTTSVL